MEKRVLKIDMVWLCVNVWSPWQTHNVILKNWVVPTKSIIYKPQLVLDFLNWYKDEPRHEISNNLTF